MQNPTPGRRPLTEAGTVVRCRRCWLCGVGPRQPCTGRGDHLGRWLAAYTDGAITRDDLKAVVVRLVVISKWAVVDEALIGRAA